MRAIDRTLAIFECFQPKRTSLSLGEIATRVGLSKPTTFRFVRALAQRGYLVQLDNQEFCLSFRFLRLAGLVDGTLGIRQIARPIMASLAQASGETVTLNTASARNRVCIDVIDSPTPLRSVTRTGEHSALAAGATAKTLMAYMSEKEKEQAIAQAVRLSGVGKTTLLRQLARIRKQGYAVTYSEQVAGLGAVSAPVLEFDDRVRYCISVAGPVVRLQPKEKMLIPLVLKAAAQISRQMGGN